MCVNHQLSDLLVRIQVGGRTYDKIIKVQCTVYNLKILSVLYRQGAISSFYVGNHKDIFVYLKYFFGKPFIRNIKVISTPGKRVYWTLNELSRNYNRNSLNAFYILSTSKGLLTSTECLLSHRLGGEVLLKIEFN